MADTFVADTDALVADAPHANGLNADQAPGTTVAYDWSAMVKQNNKTSDDVFANAGDKVTVAVSRTGTWLASDAGTPASSFDLTAYDTPQAGTIRVAVPANATGQQTMRVTLTPTASNGESVGNATQLNFTITATSGGGSSNPCDSVSNPIAPTIGADPGTPDGLNSWYLAAPTVSATAASGTTIEWATEVNGGSKSAFSSTVPTLGAGTTVVYARAVDTTCTDKISSEDSMTINVDTDDPTASLVGGPDDGASYYFGFVPAAPTCTASDPTPGSGLDGTCTVSGYSTAVGSSHTVTASATDYAGRTGSDSHSYSVLAWTLSGFYQPVDMTPAGGTTVWNTVKNGSTVPLKFEIFAGSQELTELSRISAFTQQKVPCDVGSAEDAIEITSTGGTTLRYDTLGGQYIQNWQTPKQAGTCWIAKVTTADGGTISANFKLK